jgi:hypothetical protein
MKRKIFGIAGALAVLLALGLVLSGCDNPSGGGGGSKTETFMGIAGEKTYVLVITDDTSYVLTVINGSTTKTSNGNAEKTDDGWELTPSNGAAFTVETGSGEITGMDGTITYEGNVGTEEAPETITPVSDEYSLQWAAIDITYEEVQSYISAQGWNIAGSGSNWKLATGSTATTVYNWCLANIPSNAWLDSGTLNNSFQNLLNFKEDGIGLPAGLKNSPYATRANVPLAGIFDAGRDMVVLFYVTEK